MFPEMGFCVLKASCVMKCSGLYLSRKFLWVPAVALGLAGCTGGSSSTGLDSGGGGGGGGDVAALSLPSDLALVDFDSDENPNALVSRAVNESVNKPQLNFDHDVMRPIQQAEMILCFFDHLKYQDNDNCEPYGVLMDMSLCESGASEKTEENAQQEGSQSMTVTVLSCQETPESPLRVQLSFEGDGGDRLFVEAVIYAGPVPDGGGSAKGDFGKFILSWREGNDNSGALWTLGETEDGILTSEGSAQKGWSFYESSARGDGGSERSRAKMVVGTTGRRASVGLERGGSETSYTVFTASDSDKFVIRPVGGLAECYDKQEYNEEIWSYDISKKVGNNQVPVELTTALQFKGDAICKRPLSEKISSCPVGASTTVEGTQTFCTKTETVRGNLDRWGVRLHDYYCSMENGTKVHEENFSRGPGSSQGRELTYVKTTGRMEYRESRKIKLSDLGDRTFLLRDMGSNYTVTKNEGADTVTLAKRDFNFGGGGSTITPAPGRGLPSEGGTSGGTPPPGCEGCNFSTHHCEVINGQGTCKEGAGGQPPPSGGGSNQPPPECENVSCSSTQHCEPVNGAGVCKDNPVCSNPACTPDQHCEGPVGSTQCVSNQPPSDTGSGCSPACESGMHCDYNTRVCVAGQPPAGGTQPTMCSPDVAERQNCGSGKMCVIKDNAPTCVEGGQPPAGGGQPPPGGNQPPAGGGQPPPGDNGGGMVPSMKQFVIEVKYMPAVGNSKAGFYALRVAEENLQPPAMGTTAGKGMSERPQFKKVDPPFLLMSQIDETSNSGPGSPPMFPFNKMLWMQSNGSDSPVTYMQGDDSVREQFSGTIAPNAAILKDLDADEDGVVEFVDDGMRFGPDAATVATYHFVLAEYMLYSTKTDDDGEIVKDIAMKYSETSLSSTDFRGFDRGLRLKDATEEQQEMFFNWFDGGSIMMDPASMNGGDVTTQATEMLWENFQGLTESDGSYATLGEAIRFTYRHTKENDRVGDDNGKQYGQSFMLQYMGRGQLFGLPGEYDDQGRYHPFFSLKDDVVLTADDGTEYLVKAIQGARRMKKLTGADACSSITATTGPGAPDGLPYDAASNETVTPSNYTESYAISDDEIDILVNWVLYPSTGVPAVLTE